jgi:hypothetical protein
LATVAERGLSRAAGNALLRLCADPLGDHGATLGALDRADWPALADAAIAWRCAPLLSRAVAALPPSSVPQAVRDHLIVVCRWYRLNALRQKSAAAHLAARLAASGYDALFLKGPLLAWSLCPVPELRPMRDIDVLLPPDQAAAAQAALLGDPRYAIHPELPGTRRSSPEHHPPLRDAMLAVTIEIHHSIGFPDASPEGAALTQALGDGARDLRLGDAVVKVPRAEATLVHLAAAAVRKDRLAAAPLVLADLHWLAKSDLDWDAVWRIAGAAGARRSVALLAAVAHRFGATWVPPMMADAAAKADPFVSAAAAALLVPPGTIERRHIIERVEREADGRWAGLGALRLALSPDPAQLARIVGVGGDSAWRWLGWPLWFATRAADYARARIMSGQGAATPTAAMRDWIDGG